MWQIKLISSSECPWNRSPGTLWFTTDASAKGWGATFNGLAVSGVWTGPQLHWHIKLPRVAGSTPGLEPSQEHVLVRTDSTATGCRISTDKVVYASVACRNSPATSSSGVGSIAPFIFRACSTGQPTSCHELRSPERETPSPDDPADLATFRTRTGRPVSRP